MLFSLARELIRPGFTVWDIGANQGLFAFPAAWLAGPDGLVIAFEPDVWLADLLTNSCTVNATMSRAPVIVAPLAVSDAIGQREFCIARRARASSHLRGYGCSQSGGDRGSLRVLTVTLDWLVQHFPSPQVVKIDVEGAEASVLRGAATLLRSHRPALICEINSENTEECTEILKSFAYTIYDGSERFGSRQKMDRCPWSTVAIPEDAGAIGDHSIFNVLRRTVSLPPAPTR